MAALDSLQYGVFITRYVANLLSLACHLLNYKYTPSYIGLLRLYQYPTGRGTTDIVVQVKQWLVVLLLGWVLQCLQTL